MPKNRSALHVKQIALMGVLFLLATLGGYFGSARLSDQARRTSLPETQVVQEEPINATPNKEACLAALPADIKFAQKLMYAVYSDQAEAITPIAGSLGIGGVILMDETPAASITTLRDSFLIPPIIAVDQEGGTVQRYKSHGILPGASTISKVSIDESYASYLKDSQHLAELGITTNFAPVVDVESRTPSPLPGRMYSSSPETVTLYAKKAIEAMRAVGMQPVIKHFPGMGSASGNTDFTTATTDQLSVLEGRDLLPYKDLASSKPDVMIGNMVVPGLTNGQPAIWSRDAVTLLRTMGYEDAVVYSDSLTAEAVPGTIEEATIKAWDAGVDIVVIVQQRDDIGTIASSVDSIIAKRVSAINQDASRGAALNESAQRIFARKGFDPCTISQEQ